MGGRGTFSVGKNPGYNYKTVAIIDGVKVLRPISETVSLKLPEESHSSTRYVLYDKDGVFHQYREYNNKHEVVFEIGYHQESGLGNRDVLHVHQHTTPGVEYHNNAKKYKISPGEFIYEKYKNLFKGVKLNEGK